MKRFQFKFATILKQRRTREEDSLRALGAAQRAYQEELNKKQRLLFDLDRAYRRRETLASEPIGVLAFQLEDEFIQGTKHRITRQDQAIMRASRGVEKALRTYLHARKQTKMMETLYDKAYAEYRKAKAKEEQKRQDDIAIMRSHFKKMMEAQA